jgi:hypothetical protein
MAGIEKILRWRAAVQQCEQAERKNEPSETLNQSGSKAESRQNRLMIAAADC